MQAGFAVYSRGEDVEFRIFGKDPADRSPLVTFAKQSDRSAVLMGRLYYWSELLAQLPEAGSHPVPSSDAELALAAYGQWGLDGIARLEGDFSLVLWDARKRLLIGSRDPLGGYPLFWASGHGALAMSTGLGPLLALLPRQVLNLDYLGEFLMLPALAFQQVPSENCVYQGIHRVVAGSMVQAHVHSGHVEQRVFWDWLERLVDPGTDRTEEIADQVAERLRGAVQQRVSQRTAAHLSGGMDSTAVALLARDCLSAGGREMPLHTLSLVYERLESLTRETSYLRSALAHPSGILAHTVPADDLLAYDSFVDPPLLEEPYGGLLDLGKDRVLVETAAAAGADTILTGLGADDIMDVFPHHIAELLRKGRIRVAWQESCRWASATNGSPWHFLQHFGIHDLLPAALRAGAGVLFRGGYAGRNNTGEGAVAPWILPGFARAHALRRHGIRGLQSFYSNCRPVGLSLAMGAIRAYNGDNARWSLGAPQGIVITHPFLDTRLLRLGLGIQARFRQEPGRPKPILAHAMRDVLPECIRSRRRKGHYNEVYYTGLARHLPALEAMVLRSPVDDLGLLDKGVLLQHLRQAALGIEHSPAGSIRLDLTLALIHWLSAQTDVESAGAGWLGSNDSTMKGP